VPSFKAGVDSQFVFLDLKILMARSQHLVSVASSALFLINPNGYLPCASRRWIVEAEVIRRENLQHSEWLARFSLEMYLSAGGTRWRDNANGEIVDNKRGPARCGKRLAMSPHPFRAAAQRLRDVEPSFAGDAMHDAFEVGGVGF
jgi:hypothetical protein